MPSIRCLLTIACLSLAILFGSLCTATPAAVHRFAKGPGHRGIFGYGLRGWRARSYPTPQTIRRAVPATPRGTNNVLPQTASHRGPVNRFHH